MRSHAHDAGDADVLENYIPGKLKAFSGKRMVDLPIRGAALRPYGLTVAIDLYSVQALAKDQNVIGGSHARPAESAGDHADLSTLLRCLLNHAAQVSDRQRHTHCQR